MSEYYEALDTNEKKRIKEVAKQRYNETKEQGGQAWKDFLKHYELNSDAENFTEQAILACENLLVADLKQKQENRMNHVIVPNSCLPLNITDKEGNSVYRLVVYKPQVEDVIKALRKKGYTAKSFTYDRESWEKENQERGILKEQVTNLTTTLMKTAVAAFQAVFVALMHLKVVRAYIDGVLRFNIPPQFFIGVVIPRKGTERSILTEMTDALADFALKEMYGEKTDANDADDYWPFVCVNLTSPSFLHEKKLD